MEETHLTGKSVVFSRLAFIVFSICLGLSVAQGRVVTGTNIELGPSDFGMSDYMLTIWQDEAATDHTSAYFDLEGFSLVGRSYNVDESSDWYVVNQDDIFSAATIDSGIFDPFIIGSTGQLATIPAGGEFLLGVNTGIWTEESGSSRNVFGWARLYNNGSTLTLLDSAVAYDSEGIIAGTTVEIPEPSSVCVFAIVSMAAFRRRR